MVDGSGAGGAGGGTTAGRGNWCVEPDVEPVWPVSRPYHADLSFSQQQPMLLLPKQPLAANVQKTQPVVLSHI